MVTYVFFCCILISTMYIMSLVNDCIKKTQDGLAWNLIAIFFVSLFWTWLFYLLH